MTKQAAPDPLFVQAAGNGAITAIREFMDLYGRAYDLVDVGLRGQPEVKGGHNTSSSSDPAGTAATTPPDSSMNQIHQDLVTVASLLEGMVREVRGTMGKAVTRLATTITAKPRLSTEMASTWTEDDLQKTEERYANRRRRAVAGGSNG